MNSRWVGDIFMSDMKHDNAWTEKKQLVFVFSVVKCQHI